MRMNPRNTNEYYPYICKEDAQAEYNSLRAEILESQKQRVTLLTGSLAFIGALFSYLVKDKTFLYHEAVILIILTIPASLYAYSTRIRERRIASYICMFLEPLSYWSRASSAIPKLQLGFFQRASTAMIAGLIVLDCVLVYAPYHLDPQKFDVLLFTISIAAIIFNAFVLYFTANLRDFKSDFEQLFQKDPRMNKLEGLSRKTNEKNTNLKIIAGTIAIIGIIFGFFELVFKPSALILESSPEYPTWLYWVRWTVTSGAMVIYMVVDYMDRRAK